jgi:SAM-dependent methyltransferase
MAEHFNAYSAYYSLLYQKKDYTAEVNYIHEAIQDHLPGAVSFLEFGSGTGGHGLLLNKKGYSGYGLELSEGMVQQALNNGYSCEQKDIATPFNLNKSFDVVLSLFHVMSYLSNNDQLINALANAHSHLNANGLFVFDVWFTPAVHHLRPETRKKIVENEQVKVIRIAEPVIYPTQNVVDVNYHVLVIDKITQQVHEFTETHPMRHFSISEIDLIAKHTGFELVKAEEFGTGHTSSENTWGVCFILKKVS